MEERKKFDIAIVGAGPGGYTAAIRSAQLGKSVALVEKGDLGGTCLNVGCIPTKTLLANASLYHQMKRADLFGISLKDLSFNYAKMKERKDLVVKTLRSGVETLMKSNHISCFKGEAKFDAKKTLKIRGKDNLFIDAENIVIATGSIPLETQAFPCDHQRILNSTSILELQAVPKKLIIVGGGYIGCEFASLFRELGAEVVILEALPTILAPQGDVVSEYMTKVFKSAGIQIETNVMVESVENLGNEVKVTLKGGKTVKGDFCLVSIGRKVQTDQLMLEKAGLKTTEKGFLVTNNQMETEVKGIYAIGDVTGKWMLAHVASHQGIVAASNAAGHVEYIDYRAVPSVIFTMPEVAMVGLSVKQAKEAGCSPVAANFPFQALGKAHASIETDGFSQIVIDEKTGEILGATIIGHEASNLISEMALAIQNELTIESLTQTIHPHPTISETWLENGFLVQGFPIHLPRSKKA